MKSLFKITMIMALLCLGFTNAYASDQSLHKYESEIDNMISFYEGRLYLSDSEYRILSDIAEDAGRMVQYLKLRREKLVTEMAARDVGRQSKKIRAFVSFKARYGDFGLAYTME